jgi:hypothetical protein
MWSTTLWQGGSVWPKARIMRDAAVLAAALVVQVLVARALTLLPLTLLADTWRPPRSKISLNQAACIWWAGSMRGAGEARCKGRGAEGGRLFGWQQSACLPVKPPASCSPTCPPVYLPPILLLAVTVDMAFQNFAAPNPKQEQVDSQIILLASNGAVIFFTGG